VNIGAFDGFGDVLRRSVRTGQQRPTGNHSLSFRVELETQPQIVLSTNDVFGAVEHATVSDHLFEAANQPVEHGLTQLWRSIEHDLNRFTDPNMVRAGVPQSVAMSISGHKTVSMFLRYNITSGADQLDALKRTAVHLAAQPKKQTNVVDMPDAASR